MVLLVSCKITIFGTTATEPVALGVDPGFDRHKVGDETRDGALEQGVVTHDNVLKKDVRLVGLGSD